MWKTRREAGNRPRLRLGNVLPGLRFAPARGRRQPVAPPPLRHWWPADRLQRAGWLMNGVFALAFGRKPTRPPLRSGPRAGRPTPAAALVASRPPTKSGLVNEWGFPSRSSGAENLRPSLPPPGGIARFVRRITLRFPRSPLQAPRSIKYILTTNSIHLSILRSQMSSSGPTRRQFGPKHNILGG